MQPRCYSGTYCNSANASSSLLLLLLCIFHSLIDHLMILIDIALFWFTAFRCCLTSFATACVSKPGPGPVGLPTSKGTLPVRYLLPTAEVHVLLLIVSRQCRTGSPVRTAPSVHARTCHASPFASSSMSSPPLSNSLCTSDLRSAT